jgi:hypothetical protein
MVSQVSCQLLVRALTQRWTRLLQLVLDALLFPAAAIAGAPGRHGKARLNAARTKSLE